MITKDMTIGQVLSLDRNCAPVFMSFGMFCLTCPHATAESLENATAAHGVDADELVKALNEYFDGKKAEN